jgi:hypothetical protein
VVGSHFAAETQQSFEQPCPRRLARFIRQRRRPQMFRAEQRAVADQALLIPCSAEARMREISRLEI